MTYIGSLGVSCAHPLTDIHRNQKMNMTLKGALAFTVVSLLMPCLLICLQAGCATRPPTASELQRLQGYWEGDGAAGKCSITITGNSLHFYVRTDFWFETTFALPTGTDPQQLHATIKDSSPPTNGIGQVVFAIFKIEDGTLTLAVDDMSDEPLEARGAAPLEISGTALFNRAVWGTRVLAGPNTTGLCCWFIEDNGAGESGYVAVDARRGYQPPEGGGLFQTVYELREGIKRQKAENAQIVPSFGGRVPKGWKIRDLTDDEVRILTSEK